jgi:hypothetical protein
VQADLKVINDVLTKLIREAQASREAADVEDLQDIDYTASSDPSLLRFLVDLRGEETTNKQVREDADSKPFPHCFASPFTYMVSKGCRRVECQTNRIYNSSQGKWEGRLHLTATTLIPLTREGRELRFTKRTKLTIRLQLRDDLMTMLVAGHETTAAVLTWSAFLLSTHPETMAEVQAEVDEVLGKTPGRPTFDDLKKLQKVRHVIAESLRLYPEPPILIRRALEKVELPQVRFATIRTHSRVLESASKTSLARCCVG